MQDIISIVITSYSIHYTKLYESKVISEVFKTQVELSTVTDEKLMGGFILRVGDQQIDASVATKLNNIKRKFIERTV